MTNRDNTAVWEAELRDMPDEVIWAYLRGQGHGDVADVLERRAAGEDVPLIRYGGSRVRPNFTIDEDDDNYTPPPPHRSYQVNVTVGEVRKGTPLPFDAEEDSFN